MSTHIVNQQIDYIKSIVPTLAEGNVVFVSSDSFCFYLKGHFH